MGSNVVEINTLRHRQTIRVSQPGEVPIQIKKLETGDVQRWDRFVDTCPQATFFHRAGWQEVIRRAFNHDTYFLYAEIDGEIQGVLPLGHIRSRLFSNALISAPFCVYGGIAANTAQARAALEQAACNLADSLAVDYLEMRNRERLHPDWPTKDNLYVTFRKAIDPDPDANMKAIPRKQRAMVRKGIQASLVSEIDEGVERFYDVYSESVRNLGTPVFSLKYFRILKQVFGKDCEVLMVTRKGETIAGVMSFYFRDEVMPYYGGGTARARAVKANDFMYWEVMRQACQRGIRIFDYGRSKLNTGSHSFKKNWGFEPESLHYEYRLIKAKEIPDISPLNPKYRLFINLWQSLPVSVSRCIGPVISRNLG